MSDKSKIKIARAFEELLQSRSISKITISHIVEACGISRQTFYNHFPDIYALIYWAHESLIEEAVTRFWQVTDFCLAFEMCAATMREHRVFYQQIIRMDGPNSFLELFAQENVRLSALHLQRDCGVTPDESTLFLLQLYWHGAARMLLDWIRQDMPQDPRALALLLYEGLPRSLRRFWPEPEGKQRDE